MALEYEASDFQNCRQSSACSDILYRQSSACSDILYSDVSSLYYL